MVQSRSNPSKRQNLQSRGHKCGGWHRYEPGCGNLPRDLPAYGVDAFSAADPNDGGAHLCWLETPSIQNLTPTERLNTIP